MIARPRFERIAVTGGSGRLGRYVCRALRDAGMAVCVVDRVPPAEAFPHAAADLLDLESLTTAFRGHDAVVHLAAIPNPFADPPDRILTVNAFGTWLVMTAAVAAGVRRAVVASSDSATGLVFKAHDVPPDYLPVDEDHPLRPTEAYGLSKQLAETIAASVARGAGIELVVLRPVYVAFPELHRDLPARGRDPASRNLWSYVMPEDAARAFALALARRTNGIETYFIAASNTLSPIPTLDLLAARYGRLPPLRDPERWTRDPFASVVSIDRARAALGFESAGNWRSLP